MSLGTVSTGAFDDLAALSAVAKENNIWFHVDGAFGSFVVLDPSRQSLIVGLSEADSLAFDFHKWLHAPYAAGCVLLREIAMLHATFSSSRNYLVSTKRGFAGDNPWFCEMGIELSRPCRALKVWFTLKEHGVTKLGQSIAANCDHAQYLADLLSFQFNSRSLIPACVMTSVGPYGCWLASEQANKATITTTVLKA